MTDDRLRMPCLESPFFGFHHTVDSALELLAEMGVSSSRITIEMTGRGYPSRWILAQDPPPGAVLDWGTQIKLKVSGLGYFHALPVGMWDKGGEIELGTQEILSPLDDPLQKGSHWVREGARLFDLQPANFGDCSRWISLFGLNPDDWPRESWYHLSLLLPQMQRLAGTETGIRLAFRLLLDLPLKHIRMVPTSRYIPPEDCTRLGASASRLGIDCIVGDHIEDFAGLWLFVGPLRLAKYYECQDREKKKLITAVLQLSMSCQRRYWVSWLVEDATKAPRLGIEVENARLGINSHLGRIEPAYA
jgi:hypothetical protein